MYDKLRNLKNIIYSIIRGNGLYPEQKHKYKITELKKFNLNLVYIFTY